MEILSFVHCKAVGFTLGFCLQVAEFIDERPDAVKLMEEFRRNAKWKLLGGESGAFPPLAERLTAVNHGIAN